MASGRPLAAWIADAYTPEKLKAWLDAQGLAGSIGVANGLVVCSVALVIFEIRKVELADYLPALAVAPLLGGLLG